VTGRGIPVNGGVVSGDILIHMNNNGNPRTLVASHPGNTNALKYGVHSSQSIEPRAAEIVSHLTESFEFSVPQRIAVEQVGRFIAILEAIDRDLDDRGLVDKRGEARSLLNHRSRISRQLDRELAKIAPSIERQTADRQAPSQPGRSDYVAELQRIALGQDTAASTRDRVSALKELVEIDSEPGEATVVYFNIPADRMPQRMRDVLSHEQSDSDGNATDALLADGPRGRRFVMTS
jgi:hypothetical protein